MKVCTLVLVAILVITLTEAIKFDLGVRQTNTLTTSLGRLRKPQEQQKEKLTFEATKTQKRANWRIPLIGNLTYWGEYFATVGIGSPAQYVELQVDTGSTDLIVYSKDCNGCNASASYDQSASSTVQTFYCDSDQFTCYTPNNDCDGTDLCAWEDQFGDGSTIDGYVVQDLLTIPKMPQMQNPVSLGTIESVDAPNGFEAFGVDGIWGLAYQDLSGWGGDPAIAIIFDEYNMYRSFDMCLGDNGGVLAIGDDYSSDPRFVWTEIQQELWYTVYLTDWRIGGVSLNISESYLNWNGVIVDSGTTLLIVPYWIMNPIKAYLNSLCSTVNLTGICGVPAGKTLFDGQCFNMTNAQVAQFPTMSFGFYGIKNPLPISPDDYLWQGTGVPGQYCLGIQDIDDTLPVILGDVFIQNYHVVFDRQAEKVGFGPLSSCPK